jgi:hypothetical protein
MFLALFYLGQIVSEQPGNDMGQRLDQEQSRFGSGKDRQKRQHQTKHREQQNHCNSVHRMRFSFRLFSGHARLFLSTGFQGNVGFEFLFKRLFLRFKGSGFVVGGGVAS